MGQSSNVYIQTKPYSSVIIYLFFKLTIISVSEYYDCNAMRCRWYEEWKLRDYGLSKTSLLEAYFVAAASIFEPERANERLAWAKTASLVETITSYFNNGASDGDKAFVDEFRNLSNMQDYEVAW